MTLCIHKKLHYNNYTKANYHNIHTYIGSVISGILDIVVATRMTVLQVYCQLISRQVSAHAVEYAEGSTS